MKHEANNSRAWLRRILPIVVAITLAVIAGGLVHQTSAQKLSPRNKQSKFVQGSNDVANTIFSGGRDFISDEQWAKAEQKFSQYVSTYPNEKNADAAFYWMAYSQYKLNRFGDARVTIARLLNNYPSTSWKDDAKTLLAQIPGQSLGVGVGVGSGSGRGNGSLPDDDPCEFKIVVLQALFQSDVQRGIAVATDWLKPGSNQTLRCKGAALTLLARNGGKAVTPVILQVAQNETDLKLRAKAISVLGATNDDSVIDPLRDLALNAPQNEIAEAALYALSQHTSPRAITVLSEIAVSSRPLELRKGAIMAIANRSGEPAVDALLKIYESKQDIETRKAVISGLSRRRSDRAYAKLIEIARNGENIEIRKSGISGIGRRGGEQAIGALLGLYDSEKDEELRDQIVNSLAYSNDPRITRKLIDIAKDPKTPMERRKRAIGWLSRSKDPEVIKFLEDLLKQ
jgi:HEAT repeat protein